MYCGSLLCTSPHTTTSPFSARICASATTHAILGLYDDRLYETHDLHLLPTNQFPAPTTPYHSPHPTLCVPFITHRPTPSVPRTDFRLLDLILPIFFAFILIRGTYRSLACMVRGDMYARIYTYNP
ncbi:hypothetical protein BV25DRAFT_1820309 [Artomyces pyxidatus]|uniref:Uncharacterized protein n=1 Tax=Artomyces pyxidatus TaxID=48021 RepID=A0ACB8TCX0_9AGAM|nr:hypothetical protein BV25DRAFT_1820309 [Artomyces pyxidatus]